MIHVGIVELMAKNVNPQNISLGGILHFLRPSTTQQELDDIMSAPLANMDQFIIDKTATRTVVGIEAERVGTSVKLHIKNRGVLYNMILGASVGYSGTVHFASSATVGTDEPITNVEIHNPDYVNIDHALFTNYSEYSNVPGHIQQFPIPNTISTTNVTATQVLSVHHASESLYVAMNGSYSGGSRNYTRAFQYMYTNPVPVDLVLFKIQPHVPSYSINWSSITISVYYLNSSNVWVLAGTKAARNINTIAGLRIPEVSAKAWRVVLGGQMYGTSGQPDSRINFIKLSLCKENSPVTQVSVPLTKALLIPVAVGSISQSIDRMTVDNVRCIEFDMGSDISLNGQTQSGNQVNIIDSAKTVGTNI